MSGVRDEVAVLVPAYEPDGQLAALAAALRGGFARLVVVDDGSSPARRAAFDAVRAAGGEVLVQHTAAAALLRQARREGIDITEADLDAKYQELSRQYDLSVELLRQQLPPLRLRHDLRLAAAQAVVVDSAKRK